MTRKLLLIASIAVLFGSCASLRHIEPGTELDQESHYVVLRVFGPETVQLEGYEDPFRVTAYNFPDDRSGTTFQAGTGDSVDELTMQSSYIIGSVNFGEYRLFKAVPGQYVFGRLVSSFNKDSNWDWSLDPLQDSTATVSDDRLITYIGDFVIAPAETNEFGQSSGYQVEVYDSRDDAAAFLLESFDVHVDDMSVSLFGPAPIAVRSSVTRTVVQYR